MRLGRLLVALAVAAVAVGTALHAAGAQTEATPLPKKAVCAVDAKAINVASETLTIYVNGKPRFFCAAACRDKFVQRPEPFVKEVVYCTVQEWFKGFLQPGRRAEVNNNLYYLCCEPCVGWMRDKPWLYLKEAQDPVSHKWFKVVEDNPRSSIAAQVFLFASPETKATFDKDPKAYVLPFRK